MDSKRQHLLVLLPFAHTAAFGTLGSLQTSDATQHRGSETLWHPSLTAQNCRSPTA